MPYMLKYTAKTKTWGGAVQAGESFTVVQYSNGPDYSSLKKHLQSIGRAIHTCSSIGGGGLNVGETKQINEWIVERIS